MEVALSQRQLNNLIKGRPVQISHSSLTSSSPNVAMEQLSDSLRKKIERAVKETRGCRVQLSPEEAMAVKTSLSGGKIKMPSSLKQASKKLESGGKIKMPSSLKRVGKSLEGAAKAVDKGFKQKIVDSGVGKQMAKELIDIGANVVLPAALGGVSMLAGDPTGKSGEMLGQIAGMQIDKAAERYGYGIKGKQLKAIKDKMTEMFKPLGKQARQLTTKVFKEGDVVLDLPEVSIRGGKINMKSLNKTLKKGAKELWREAKPVLKYFGEEAIKMAEPLIEEGLSAVAQSYGVPPPIADAGAKTLVSVGKAKAQRGLDKYVYKGKSQSPQMAVDKASALVQERGNQYIEKAKMKGLESIQKYVPPEQRDLATQKLLEQTNRAEKALENKVEQAEDFLQKQVAMKKKKQEGSGMCGRGRKIGRVMLSNSSVIPLTTGGAIVGSLERIGMRNDMSTLLSPYHPAVQTFHERPALPQGQISGGSFRGYGTLEMDAMLGGSFK